MENLGQINISACHDRKPVRMTDLRTIGNSLAGAPENNGTPRMRELDHETIGETNHETVGEFDHETSLILYSETMGIADEETSWA